MVVPAALAGSQIAVAAHCLSRPLSRRSMIAEYDGRTPPRSETNPEVAERADLIFRGVEIITGSRREHRYHKLIEQLKAMGGDPENPGFKFYLQAFQYGMPSHGGFGLGLERLAQRIIGFRNIKEATLFPRDMKRLAP